MSEVLDLTTPETFPPVTTWSIKEIFMSREGPAIKVTIVSNTGEEDVWRLVPTEGGTTAEQIRQGLSFINQGKFMVNQGKSLQKYLLDQMSAAGFKVGTVSGTPD